MSVSEVRVSSPISKSELNTRNAPTFSVTKIGNQGGDENKIKDTNACAPTKDFLCIKPLSTLSVVSGKSERNRTDTESSVRSDGNSNGVGAHRNKKDGKSGVIMRGALEKRGEWNRQFKWRYFELTANSDVGHLCYYPMLRCRVLLIFIQRRCVILQP